MNRRLGVASLVVVLVVTAVAAAPGALGAAPAGPAQTDTGPAPAPQTTPDGFDSTVFEVTVNEDGSARWTLRYLRLLENDSQVATFEEYAADFESTTPAFVSDFRTRAERLTTFGSNATGRNMTATDFRRDAFVRTQIGGAQATGVVELSFRWGAFARTEADSVVVSDVFQGGLYIGPDQRLVFGHGPNLTFADVEPSAESLSGSTLSDSDTVTWVGERSFLDSRPRVVYDYAQEGGGTTTESGPGAGGDGGTVGTSPGGSDPASGPSSGPGLMLPLAVGLLFLLGLGGLAWYTGALPAGQEDEQPGAAAAETGGVAEPESPGAVPEEELLSDEDRVVRLLEDNGGRMKQVDIVEETDWSKSKVSMLLSEMEEEGEISKLRVGRENIISLSGHEPDAAGSPFDEE